jgi:hypothetical protein
MILKWKGKGLRFHLRSVHGKLYIWHTEIPKEIEEEFRALFEASLPELRERFTERSEEEAVVNFDGGDLFAALQASTKDARVDYDLMKALDSKQKQDDPPWTWRPCEKATVPCCLGDHCYGKMLWEGSRFSAKEKAQHVSTIRQCQYIGRLDRWWWRECFELNIKPQMHDGRMQYMIDGMSHMEYMRVRAAEVKEDVLLAREQRAARQSGEASEEILSSYNGTDLDEIYAAMAGESQEQYFENPLEE